MTVDNIDNGVVNGKQAFTHQVYLLIVITLVLLAVFIALAASLNLLQEFVRPEAVRYEIIALALLCNLLFFLIAAFAWQQAVGFFSGVRIPLLYSFAQIALLHIGKYLPGKVWGLAIRGKDLTHRGVSTSQAVLASWAEQLISVHAGVVFGASGWLLYTRPAWWPAWLLLLWSSVPVGSRFNNQLVRLLQPLLRRVVKGRQVPVLDISIRHYLSLFGMYVLEWFSVGVILWCLWLAFYGGTGTAAGTYLVTINALAFIAGFLAFFIPGGLGVREGALAGLMTAVMGLPQALALAVMFRVWLTLSDALSGLVAVHILLGAYRRRA